MDAGVQHGRRGQAGRRPTGRPRDRRTGDSSCWSSPRPCARPAAPRATRSWRRMPGPRPRAHRVLPALRPGRHPRRPLRDPRRLRHDRGRLRPRAPGAGVRRRRPRLVPRVRPARWSTRCGPTARSTPTCRWSAACSSRRPTRPWSPTSRPRGLLFRHVPLRALLPALLALPHAAGLLRAAVLVHPDHRDQGRAARARTRGPTGTRTTIKWGRYGDWLDEQRRLGAVAQPLLGHAAADLALHRGPPHLRRVAGRARRAGRHATSPTLDPHRPYVDDVTFACPQCAADGHARARGHRRLVRQRRDALRRSGATRTRARRCSTRQYPADFICEAIDQTRGWFYTLMAVGTLVFDRVVVPDRALPGPHPRRGRPQDEQAPGQHPRADPADGRARRRRRALVHAGRPARRGRPAASGTPRSPRSCARRC